MVSIGRKRDEELAASADRIAAQEAAQKNRQPQQPRPVGGSGMRQGAAPPPVGGSGRRQGAAAADSSLPDSQARAAAWGNAKSGWSSPPSSLPDTTSAIPTPRPAVTPTPGRVKKTTTVAGPAGKTATFGITRPAAPTGRDARFNELQRQESGPKTMRGGGDDSRSRAASRLSAEEGRSTSSAYRSGEAAPKAKRPRSKGINDFSGLKFFRGK